MEYFSDHIIKHRPRLLKWYRQVKRPLPWRTRWETSGDPYVVWISEIMLQQTVIKAVIPVYERFLEKYPTVAALALTSEDELRLAVRGLGYYRRFGYMLKSARVISQRLELGQGWPDDFVGWRELPGVGDYTAAAVSSIAFNAPVGVVDGNVERVFCRLLDIQRPSNAPDLKRQFKSLVAEFVCKTSPGDFNQAIMELGQTVCTVAEPRCGDCPLASPCLARQRKTQHLAPQPKIKAKPVPITLTLTVPVRGRRIGVVQRPASDKFLPGTWGFLTTYQESSGKKVLGTVKHHITHHKITAQVTTSSGAGLEAVRWFHPAEVEENLLSNLDRKAWVLAARHLPSP